MKLLIFPKFFEFMKLLRWLGGDIISILYYEETDIYTIKYNSKRNVRSPYPSSYKVNVVYELFVFVAHSSDFEFSKTIRQLHQKISRQTKLTFTSYVLIGSCGINREFFNSNKEILKKNFLIKTAYKMGRGRLGVDNQYSFFDENLESNVKENYKISFHHTTLYRELVFHDSITSAFIIESDTIFKVLSKMQKQIYDMETYDFYDFCQYQNMETFYCIRFPTDVTIEATHEDIFKYYDSFKDMLFTDIKDVFHVHKPDPDKPVAKDLSERYDSVLREFRQTLKHNSDLLRTAQKQFQLKDPQDIKKSFLSFFYNMKNFIRQTTSVDFSFLEELPAISKFNFQDEKEDRIAMHQRVNADLIFPFYRAWLDHLENLKVRWERDIERLNSKMNINANPQTPSSRNAENEPVSDQNTTEKKEEEWQTVTKSGHKANQKKSKK